MYSNDYSSTILNSLKLKKNKNRKTTQMFKNRKDKKVYWYNEILYRNENDQITTACNNRNDSQKQKAELKESNIFQVIIPFTLS